MPKAAPQPNDSTALVFTSDRMKLLGPLVTPRVIELARQRIVTGENFFKGAKLVVSDDKTTVKLALIVAHEINSFEDFSAEEEALMRGINADTLRERKKAHVIRPL